jgi:outer membrane PBP1 activator LpoA protein
MITLKNRNVLKLAQVLLFISTAVCLSACTSSIREPLLISAAIETPYPETVTYYIDKANISQQSSERNDYLLKAAGRLIEQRELSKASSILSSIGKLAKEQQSEKTLLFAKINYLRGRNQTSLNLLRKISEASFSSRELQAYYLQLLSLVSHALNQAAMEVSARMRLEALIPAENQLYNQQQLWFALSKLPLSQVCEVNEEADWLTRGYFSLSCLSRKNQGNGVALLEGLIDWQRVYQRHPANNLLPENLTTIPKNLVSRPVKKIALLLPLNGQLSGPGKAIRDGFLTSFYQESRSKPKIRFFDTNNGSLLNHYQQALAEKSEFIVGPLDKANVQTLLGKKVEVPVLALNDLGRASQQPFFQFGLSQRDEAIQVAREMKERGKTKTLVIAPAGSWGDGIVDAFNQTFKNGGGVVVSQYRYQSNSNVKQGIRSLLEIDKSSARNADLQRLLGRNVKTITRRRDDFDSIFLLSYASKAREIKPLLNYYYAKNVEVFSTSLVFAGIKDSNRDRDLNGIWFCDMPYVLDQRRFSKQPRWPEQLNSYVRLYALGLDSYLLSKQLNQLLLFPLLGLSDNTGLLFLKDNGHIVRRLRFAKFVNGVPKA